ncbi:hypothetical protein CORC01_10820 [Colletotrichum orchidophilum]|uniref:Uncharacterized protein n=1 Tax=Colletotrichum orchidophilum TaxID=1209926 RepID=A0A1G4AXR6_9PEZI|nr:uncharacterized protein CORC01_10820 [Colletotrichum orchidophilum]OHE93921.1 hypothetical protein CORC01_10820 [Colletotrichum orchidophilum]
MPPCDPDDPDFDVHELIAVREDEGQLPEVIKQCFQLRARYSSPGLVYFRLFSAPNGMPTNTTTWLQIRANCIKSLKKTLFDKTDTSCPVPPYMDTVRRLLHGMQSVTCLQFQLHREGNIDLVTPIDSENENTPGEPLLETPASLMSLATASRFSVYFRHDILKRKTFGAYQRAILDFPYLTESDKKAYECMVDVSRLYHGAGGKVDRPHDHEGSPSTKEHRNSPGAATPASCGSTLPFEDVPPERGSPPPYDECLTEGQSPKAMSDAAAIVAESFRRDHDYDYDRDPPGYGDAEQWNDQSDSSQGVFPLGNADIHMQPMKRKRSRTTVCTATTPTRDAAHRNKSQRLPSAVPDSLLMRVFEQQQQQQQQINDLRQTVKELQKRNEELEARCDDLEKKCSEVEDGQFESVEAVGNLDIAVDELQARCDTLEKQMPDVCDEMADLKEKLLEDCREELEEDERESVEDSMMKQMRETVEAELSQARRRVLKALQPSWVNEEIKMNTFAFKFAAFVLPALNDILPKLMVSNINSSHRHHGHVYARHIGVVPEVLDEGLPRAARVTIDDKATILLAHSPQLTHALILPGPSWGPLWATPSPAARKR